jgi:LPXTG-motif cell wall-anchored protein
MTKHFPVLSFAICLMFVSASFTPLSFAQTWDQKTRVTINSAWTLPGKTVLPSGTYVMRLYDSPSNRSIVEVWNADETELHARGIGIPAYRSTPTDETVLNFYETPAPGPAILQFWFYAGSNSGVEFPAPNLVAADVSPVAVKAPEPAPSPEQPEPVAELNPVPAPEIASVEPEPEPELESEFELELFAELTPPAQPEQTTLPQTASNLPLIALIGLVSLGGAVLFRSY